jgi:plasmid maintenance system antidote protein VapI
VIEFVVMRSIADRMEEMGIDLNQLVELTGLEEKLVKAIITGNYTASPTQRQRLATALGLSPQDVSWDHAISVQHLRGNGPQSGRST